jgi:hypothetical protein
MFRATAVQLPTVCFLATAPYIIPARPWERKQQQQQAQGVSRPAQQQQQLLQQAASVVQLELQDRAQQACAEPSGAAAAALGQLFVPAVLFLSAALAASPGVHLRPLACRLVFCCAVHFHVLLISRLIKGDFEKASLSLPCCTPCQSNSCPSRAA